MCCHPDLSSRARIALTLKLAGGFSIAQIARALLSRPVAVERAISRAKQRIQASPAGVALPEEPQQLRERMNQALEIIYLIFKVRNLYGTAITGKDICSRLTTGRYINTTENPVISCTSRS